MKEYINQHYMKCLNAALVFRLVRDNERMTRKQIQARTNFSWGAVSNITSRLIESGYIKEETRVAGTTAGRTPFYLEVNGDRYCVIGLDINRSGLRAVVVNLKNEVMSSIEQSLDFNNKEDLLDAIVGFAKQALSLAGKYEVLAVGVAMQGKLDAEEGISINFPDCEEWKDVPLRDILKEKLDLPVYVEHDPDCILYAVESRVDSMLIRLDKSIGMAAAFSNMPINRAGMFEIGHVTVDPNGEKCSCGKKGCLEIYASQDGMAKIYGKDFEQLADDARMEKAEAVKLFDDMASKLALSVANSLQLLGLNRVVLCGNSMQYKDLFFDNFKEKLETISKSQIELSEVRVDRAALGAALYSVDRSLESIQL